MSRPAPASTNRLAQESSPYLLQHAHNPVDWYPWGPEAEARRNAEFLQTHLRNGAGLWRSYKNGRATINGFLEDYALVVQAYVGLPNTVLAGAVETSALPLPRERPATNGQTTLYVCFNRTCQLPVRTVAEALAQL